MLTKSVLEVLHFSMTSNPPQTEMDKTLRYLTMNSNTSKYILKHMFAHQKMHDIVNLQVF